MTSWRFTRAFRSGRGAFLAIGLSLAAGCASPAAREESVRRDVLRRDFQAGVTTAWRRDYPAALRVLDSVESRVQPGDEIAPHVIYWQGYCHEEMGDAAQAAERYERLLSDYPRSGRYAADARVRLARIRSAAPASPATP